MKSTYLSAIFSFVCTFSISQTQLNGVVNKYAKVIGLDACESALTVDGPLPFQVGEQVVIIQMKGAEINESNDNSFGDIQEIGSAGFFEKNEITAINGNVVRLKFLLVNNYDPAGSVQLVSFPVLENAVVTEIITPLPWDGAKGGVIALEISNNLELQAPIDASGAGFRGAQTNTLSNDCSFLTNANGYHYSLSNWRGAPKGEGVAGVINGKEQGRGAQANGGGGGNDHNSGGGGGANCTLAGMGGETSVGGLGCDGEFPGGPGKALPTDNNRLFLGGGGGAGHDNNGSGSNGGNGGGLVIVLANNISPNGYKILANGQAALNAVGDGAGGGGAGGTILLESNTISGTLEIELAGGDGGSVQNPSDRCIGPGGGGSGGRFVSEVNNNVVLVLAGGSPGVNLNQSNQCSDPSNGAGPGQMGTQTPFGGIPGSDVESIDLMVISQPEDVIVCEGENEFFEFLIQGQSLVYQWQINTGSGWQDIPPTAANYMGEATAVLEILNPTFAQSGYQYRCAVTGPCSAGEVSATAVLTVEAAPSASFTFDVLGNGEYQFNNTSSNANSYLWDFGDGNTSTLPNPSHTYQTGNQYSVMLTAQNGCGEVVFTQNIIIGGFPVASFSVNYINPCAPTMVQFQNQSTGQNLTSYFWEFEGGTPAMSTAQDPTVTYTMPGIYDVKLTATNALGEHTTLMADYIEIFATPVANFDFAILADTVDFINLSTGGSYWIWDFGDGNTSTESNPQHIYAQGGVYVVTLTTGNNACGSAISQELFIDLPNLVRSQTIFPSVLIFPNPVSQHLNLVFGEMVPIGTALSIIGLDGRTLLELPIFEKVVSLNIGEMADGVYIIQLKNGERAMALKFCKQ